MEIVEGQESGIRKPSKYAAILLAIEEKIEQSLEEQRLSRRRVEQKVRTSFSPRGRSRWRFEAAVVVGAVVAVGALLVAANIVYEMKSKAPSLLPTPVSKVATMIPEYSYIPDYLPRAGTRSFSRFNVIQNETDGLNFQVFPQILDQLSTDPAAELNVPDGTVVHFVPLPYGYSNSEQIRALNDPSVAESRKIQLRDEYAKFYPCVAVECQFQSVTFLTLGYLKRVYNDYPNVIDPFFLSGIGNTSLNDLMALNWALAIKQSLDPTNPIPSELRISPAAKQLVIQRRPFHVVSVSQQLVDRARQQPNG